MNRGSEAGAEDPPEPAPENTKPGPYEVGYGKPPEEHRFKPGQSGNPRGRPKGAKNLATMFREALNEPVTIRSGDKIRTMPKRRAMVEVAINRALKGDTRALLAIFKLAGTVGELTPEVSADELPKLIVHFVGPSGEEIPMDKYRSSKSAAKSDSQKVTLTRKPSVAA